MGCPTHLTFMPRGNITNYERREQAYVKHGLLEHYLSGLAYKVGTTWDALAYVDGFAGPWMTKDPEYADSSFGIAIDALSRCQAGLRATHQREIQIESILVEHDKEASELLKRFAASKRAPCFDVHALSGEFVEKIPDIEQIISANTQNPFRFVFLDPTGWAKIPMLRLQSFLRHRSCEVLINLMTRHIIRFLGEADREDSYHELFGRNEVLDKLRNTPRDERTDQAVREYCRSLRLLCGFKYVSSAVILKPNEESIGYFLVYATNDHHGILVFKDAEIKAARIQDNIRQEVRVKKAGGQLELPSADGPVRSRLILELRQRYGRRARGKVLQLLSTTTSAEGVPYKDLFCEAMAFPLVTPNDLVGWLKELKPHIEVKLAGQPTRRKPSPSEDFRVVVINEQALR
jgi:three-Cys-motif partner protein